MKASLMQKLGLGQGFDLLREMGNYIKPEEAEMLLANRHVWGAMAKAMRLQYPFNHVRLWHDLYTPSDLVQLHMLKFLKEKGLDTEKLVWVGSHEPPAFTDDPNVCVVLAVTLGSLEQTAYFLWECAMATNYAECNVLHIESFNRGTFRLVAPSEAFDAPFEPNTLQWIRMKTNNRARARGAGLVVLALAAQHPTWIRRACNDSLKVLMPKLEIYDSGRKQWGLYPALSYGASRDSLTLQGWAKESDKSTFIAPSIILP